MDFTNLMELIKQPGHFVWTLLDIAIISYIIYRLLLLIRDTRAEQLLKGLVVLLGLSLGARYLGLDALKWLMDKIWTMLFIALPVVFQPELRRALEQLGRTSFLQSNRYSLIEEEINEAITETVEACQRMAADRTGALIVWERETGLDEYMETGTRVEAVVTSQLLLNLFVPNTPLHDGAIIIRHGRIESAGCVLPLTDNKQLDWRLGTRHRAALGISEVSDALVVVVSEETGTISVADGGRISRNFTGEQLEKLLRSELLEHRPRSWHFSLENPIQ
ncbi:MAG: diadenylate cyclase CdaA [Methylocystaceae bacterium]